MCVCLFTGSASRLSRKSTYHHCTLLYSADCAALTAVLRPSCPGIHSNATPSVPSPVTNLLDHVPTLQWEELLNSLAHQYRTGAQLFACNSSEVCPLLVVDCNSQNNMSFFFFLSFQSLTSALHQPLLLTQMMRPLFLDFLRQQQSSVVGSGCLVKRLNSVSKLPWT